MLADGWTTSEMQEQQLLTIAMAYRRAVEQVDAPRLPDREEPEEHIFCLGDIEEQEKKKPIFKPSLHQQRIDFTINQIQAYVNERGPFKKLVVVGCGDLIFELNCLNKLPLWGVQSIVSFDINRYRLFTRRACFSRAADVEQKYMKMEGLPTILEVWKGDATKYHGCLAGADVVVCIEVIEHMPIPKAEQLMQVMLDLIQPKFAIVTTPNYDYNQYIPGMTSKFRDTDHDYEFTMEEFREWLEKVNRPQHYTYEIDFVGFLDRQTLYAKEDEDFDEDLYQMGNFNVSAEPEKSARYTRVDEPETENTEVPEQKVLVAGTVEGGATQIAIFKRKLESPPLPVTDGSNRDYEHAYSTVIPYGIHNVLRVAVQRAMASYLKSDRLANCHTKKLNYLYYLVPFTEVSEHASNDEYRFVMERHIDKAKAIIFNASRQFIQSVTEPMGGFEYLEGFRVPAHVPIKELCEYLEDYNW